MRPEGFALAATTNDLTREPQVRNVADVLEFRMDKAEAPLEQLSAYDGDLAILATNRPRWCGGQAEEDGRLEDLLAASAFDAVGMVDVELVTARDAEGVISEFRDNGVDVVTSHHDFDTTPGEETLADIFEQCARVGDIAKVATHAETGADALRMLNTVHEETREGREVAGISMGSVGSHTRVVAPLYGSKLGYAPVESDTTEYAPGQIPIHELASMIERLSATGDRNIQPADGGDDPGGERRGLTRSE